jgi:hypothetical protein
MTQPQGKDAETIPLFLIDSTFYFKHYFEEREVFGELSQYYNNEKYRFEVPKDALGAVTGVLEGAGTAPEPLEEYEEYIVVKEKYTNHPDVLFKRSVLKVDESGYNLFLMQDRTAVNAAITNGGVPYTETDLSFDH